MELAWQLLGKDFEKVDEKQYLNGSKPKETPVMIIQMSCNGWRVVTRQQFSNTFFLFTIRGAPMSPRWNQFLIYITHQN